MRNPMFDQVDNVCWRLQVNILSSRSAKQNAGSWDNSAVYMQRPGRQFLSAVDVMLVPYRHRRTTETELGRSLISA